MDVCGDNIKSGPSEFEAAQPSLATALMNVVASVRELRTRMEERGLLRPDAEADEKASAAQFEGTSGAPCIARLAALQRDAELAQSILEEIKRRSVVL